MQIIENGSILIRKNIKLFGNIKRNFEKGRERAINKCLIISGHLILKFTILKFIQNIFRKQI
jgi:hypothetical protein